MILHYSWKEARRFRKAMHWFLYRHLSAWITIVFSNICISSITQVRPAIPVDPKKVRDEIVQASLIGRVDFEYPLISRIVRIFTSSTFTGTFHGPGDN